MRMLRSWLCVLAAVLLSGAVLAGPLTRAQALAALDKTDAAARRAAIERLAEVGVAADAGRVVERLADIDPGVRMAAASAVWLLWGRSGDPAVDKLYARGLGQMQASALNEALATFSEVVRRKPEFAEGWNKRATIWFLLGENEKSLLDCEKVLERNPQHFGALSGAGQIHLQLGNPRRALEMFRRAVAVNPTLEGPAHLIPMIEQHLSEDDKDRT